MQFFLRQESGANCALQQKALKVVRCELAALKAYFFENCSCNLGEMFDEKQTCTLSELEANVLSNLFSKEFDKAYLC